MTDDSFAVLPTPVAYTLITIDDDDGEPIIENRLSAPETVIGFVVRKQGQQFSVLPVTPSGVHDEVPDYILVSPDGAVNYPRGWCFGQQFFCSVEDWKQYMRCMARDSYSEIAEDMAKDGEKKDAAEMRRCARAHQREIERHE